MSNGLSDELQILLSNYPQLQACCRDMINAFEMMKDCCFSKGLIMTCGNAADADHIVGELIKRFKLQRPVIAEQRLLFCFPAEGSCLTDSLQRSIPTTSLVSQRSLSSAFMNDVAADMVFAQQVFGYGRTDDVLLGISTSGNSKNVVNACKVVRSFDVGTIRMTGEAKSISQQDM